MPGIMELFIFRKDPYVCIRALLCKGKDLHNIDVHVRSYKSKFCVHGQVLTCEGKWQLTDDIHAYLHIHVYVHEHE